VRTPPNGFSARSSLQDFDLSQNKSLRALVFPAADIKDAASSFLKHVLSTVTPSASLKVIISYHDSDFGGVKSYQPYLREMSQADIAEEASRNRRLFRVLREVHKVRGFQVVLRASVWGYAGEHHVRALEQAVAQEKARKGFDDSFSEPLVLYDPRMDRTRYM